MNGVKRNDGGAAGLWLRVLVEGVEGEEGGVGVRLGLLVHRVDRLLELRGDFGLEVPQVVDPDDGAAHASVADAIHDDAEAFADDEIALVAHGIAAAKGAGRAGVGLGQELLDAADPGGLADDLDAMDSNLMEW